MTSCSIALPIPNREACWFVVVAVALGLCLCRPALAADPAAAKAHYEAATRFYDFQACEAALQEYKAGYRIRPDLSFLYNNGQCYKRLGKPTQAREFLGGYLKQAPADDPNRMQAAQE